MVINWGRSIPGWVLFAALMIIFLCYIFFPPDRKPMTYYDSQTLTSNVDQPFISDTLPHYKYQLIKDGLTRVSLKDNYFHNRSGSDIEYSHLGLYNYKSGADNDYFITIRGYDHDEDVTITNKSSGSVLTFPIWDKVEERSRDGHLENKPISIKYEEGKARWQGKVFVPVSKTSGYVFTVVFYACLILVALVCYYCVLFIPIRFFYQLAKGNAFTRENISNLYLTGWGLTGVGFFLTIATAVAHFSVRSKIPSELTFSYYAVLMAYGKYFMAGLCILLLSKGFLQGLELKEENDLTV